MYDVNFEIPAFLLSLLCFLYCLMVKRRQYFMPKGLKNKLTSQHFVFLVMLLANMLSSVSSVVGVYLVYADFSGVAAWQYAFHASYFIFHSTLSVTFTLYIMNVTGTSLNWKKGSYFLFALPYMVSELLIFTNGLTSWAFYMDENLIYHRGPLMVVLYVIGAFYIALGFVFFFKNKKAISKGDSVAVGMFIGIATLGIVIQAVRSNLLVELFSEALACLVIMIVLEDKGGHIDPTTGLLNGVAFVEANRRMLGSKQRYDVVLIRLNDTEKYVERFSGRETDAFLMKVAAYLVGRAGSNDVFCCRREVFAVIFKDSDPGSVRSFAEDVVARFCGDWTVDSIQIKADAAAMTFCVPKDVKTLEGIEDVVSSANMPSRPGSYLVSPEEMAEMLRASVYESALRRAIKGGKLRLKYQPIWSSKEKKTVSAEALLRVEEDELRNVSPEVYIPIAEKTGIIKDIGLFVFEEVCRFLKSERLKGSAIRYVELNLSVYQFMYGDLIEDFERIRNKYGVDASFVNLEITETAAGLDVGTVSEALKKFRALGYTLSLDDFGTGYSNVVRMIGNNYQNVKIDKSILWNISGGENDPDVLVNLTGFIKSSGSDVIQEGVETKEQLDLAVACGCDYIQGYYFSKPVSEDLFFDYLENEKAL